MTHTWSQLIIICWYATWIVSEYYWSVLDCYCNCWSAIPNYRLAINSYKIPITIFASLCSEITACFLKLWYLLRCEKFTFKSEGEKLAGFPPSSFCVENGYPETHIEVCFLCTFCANTPNMKSECFVQTKQVFSNMHIVNELAVVESKWAADDISYTISSKVQALESVIAYIYMYINA